MTWPAVRATATNIALARAGLLSRGAPVGYWAFIELLLAHHFLVALVSTDHLDRRLRSRGRSHGRYRTGMCRRARAFRGDALGEAEQHRRAHARRFGGRLVERV